MYRQTHAKKKTRPIQAASFLPKRDQSPQQPQQILWYQNERDQIEKTAPLPFAFMMIDVICFF